jgi:pimeloyl-ACP methyl ester carboxylesterase
VAPVSHPREQLAVATADGRSLEVVAAGPQDGRIVLLHVGTPMGAVLADAWVEAGAARDLRHVTYARPGYGESTRRPGRSVADCAGDAAAILDALGAERCVTAGLSGGGPHALACAALLADRVDAAATVAGVAPYDADGLDFLAGMGAENVEEFGAAVAGEAPLRAFLDEAAASMGAAGPDDIAAALGDLIDDVDRAALSGDVAAFFAETAHRALATGVDGWLDDDLAFVAPWGFDLGAIATPVSVWQGSHDRMVNEAHGAWLAEHVPGARHRHEPDEGHISLAFSAYDRVLDALTA